MIIVDEAHHSAARSWQKVIDRFPNAKIIHMTATPFRSDRQEIDGELVFRYPFRSATLKGYIKRLKASYVAPTEIELGFADERGQTYTLEDVLKLKEEEWFSRGVALVRRCNHHPPCLRKFAPLRQSAPKSFRLPAPAIAQYATAGSSACPREADPRAAADPSAFGTYPRFHYQFKFSERASITRSSVWPPFFALSELWLPTFNSSAGSCASLCRTTRRILIM